MKEQHPGDDASEKRTDLEARMDEAIRDIAGDLIALASSLADVAELGFDELRTASRVASELHALGLAPRSGVACTGIVADVHTPRAGPTVAVLGELDALPFPGPDPGTPTVAHSCGHNLQLAIMIGVGAAIGAVADALSGRLRLMAVPAEEFVDLDSRMRMQEAGKLEFLSGKAEMVRLGEFDEVDVALMVHSSVRREESPFAVGGNTNGLVAKRVRYVGRAAHAGAAPEQGVNALAAATVGLHAIDALRETFPDGDRIRVQSVVTSKGGPANIVPSNVELEIYVRAATAQALERVGAQVDRAVSAGALALGADVTVYTIPGYLPLRQHPGLVGVLDSAARGVVGRDVRQGVNRGGSTDLGDLSHLMPVAQGWAGGVAGNLHGSDFRLEDGELAIVTPARILARAVAELLLDPARVTALFDGFRPELSKRQYVSYLRRTRRVKTFTNSR
jgi:amidohydrolase